MKGRRQKFALGAVLVALLAMLVWWFLREGSPAGPARGRAVDPEFLRSDVSTVPGEKPEAPVPDILESDLRDAPSVLVLDPEGAPVEGARVEIVPLGTSSAPLGSLQEVGTTDAAGCAVLTEKRWPLPVVVRATHPSFAPGDGRAVEGVTEVVVRLEPPSRADGIVVDEFDHPLPGATVTLRCVEHLHSAGTYIGLGGVIRFETETDGEGRFHFGALPLPHWVVLGASADGYVEVAKREDPDNLGDLRVVLHRPFRSVIRLVDPSGTPLPNGTVGVYGGAETMIIEPGSANPESEWLPFRSEGDGTYTRTGLPPGWYTCLAVHPGCRPRVVPMTLERRRDGPEDIVLEGVAGVTGHVVDAATGRPMAGVRVTAAPPTPWSVTGERVEYVEGKVVRSAGGGLVLQTDEGGMFRLTTAEPGDEMQIVLVSEGYAWTIVNLREQGIAQPLELSMTPQKRMAIEGRVVEIGGAPLAHALLRWYDGSTTTGEDGRFTIPSIAILDFVLVEAVDHFPLGITMRGRSAGDQGDWVMARMRRLRGLVVDTDGRGVARSLVARSTGPTGYEGQIPGEGMGSSNMDGQVKLAVVDGVDYHVTTRVPETPPAEVLVPAEGDDSFILQVPAKAAAGAVLMGRLEVDGAPWTGPRAFVNLVDPGKHLPVGRAAAGPDGRFRMEHAPAGTWDLQLNATEGFRGVLRGLVIPATGTVEVVLPCVPRDSPAEPPQPVHLRVRPLPGETDGGPRTLRGWMAEEGRWRSLALRPEPEGLYGLSTWPGGPVNLYLFDRAGERAGVAVGVETAKDIVVDLPLVPAGRVVLPKGEPWATPTIRVRNPAGALVLNVRSVDLSRDADGAAYVLLPGGAWDISVSDDDSAEGTKHRVVVTAGESVRLP